MTTVEQVDADIRTLHAVNEKLSQSLNLCFLVTGSYAIEALTGNRLVHNDIDTNILAPDLPRGIDEAAVLLEQMKAPTGKLQLYKRTSDRLEYDVPPIVAEKTGPQRLEIHVVEATTVTEESGQVFSLTDRTSGKISQVAIEKRALFDSKGREYLFKVKSLAYSIATWAIRVSGAAENQLRPVKDSDISGFALLLVQEFLLTNVYSAIEHHPQRPEYFQADEVFKKAVNAISDKKG